MRGTIVCNNFLSSNTTSTLGTSNIVTQINTWSAIDSVGSIWYIYKQVFHAILQNKLNDTRLPSHPSTQMVFKHGPNGTCNLWPTPKDYILC